MNKEIWKDIEGYEGLYQVSNLGRIKSLPKFHRTNKNYSSIGYLSKEKILKNACDNAGKGYLYVNLGRNGRIKVHRAVAMAFIPNPNNYKEVNHIDGNPKNNNANNLEWVTHQENCLHYTYKLGQHSGQFKMKKVKIINKYNQNTKEFESITQAVRWIREHTKYFKASESNANKVINRDNKTMYGYIWRELTNEQG